MLDVDATITWDGLRKGLRGFGNAGPEIADDAMKTVADIAAGIARDLAPGSLAALVDVEKLGPGQYAVVGRKRIGSDEQVFNIQTHGSLGRRTKKKRTRNGDREGGIRPKNILTKARRQASKSTPGAIVAAMIHHGRRNGFDMKRGG